MNEACATEQRVGYWNVRSPISVAQPAHQRLGCATDCNRAKIFAIEELQAPDVDPAKAERLLQYRLEHRCEVTGRGVDDLQDLGGRGLLIQRLAGLGDEPRILHCDHRLAREIFEQRDFLSGE